MGCVYELNLPDGSKYVGMTRRTFDLRSNEHKRDSRGKSRSLIAEAVKAVGWPNVSAKSLYEDVETDFEMLVAIESEFIAFYRQEGVKLYNISDGGWGQTGVVFDEERRKKVSETSKRSWTPDKKIARSLVSRGENSPTAVINTEKVYEIRKRLATGEAGVSIANSMNISKSIVSNIRTGKTWQHLK